MITRCVLLLFSLVIIGCFSNAGENIFETAQWQNSEFGRFDKASGVVSVEVPTGTSVTEATKGVTARLDNAKVAGKTIRFSFKVRTEEVVPGPAKHHIAKMLLAGKTQNDPYYKGSPGSSGTSDWKSVTYRVPFYQDNIELSAVFGLQHTTGKAWFKDIRAEECDPFEIFRLKSALPQDFRCEYSDEVKNMAPRRGVVAEYYVFDDPTALETLTAWNVNLIRLWLGEEKSNLNLATYEEKLEKQFSKIKKLCPEFEKRGIKVILTFRAPGGRFQDPKVLGTAGEISSADNERSGYRLFESEECLAYFVRLWEKAARTFQNESAVWAYDLLNEPVQISEVKNNYLEVQKQAAEAIRRIDPEKPIVIASNYWGGAATFCYLEPLPLKNIVYQFHCYQPGTYTHQGVADHKKWVKEGNPIHYPGKTKSFGLHGKRLGMRYWDKEAVRKELTPVVEFQKKYGAVIYAGEFSVIRWAPDGDKYLSDMVELLEENNWHWTYHTFRERWNGWSLEHSDNWQNQQPTSEDSARKKVILHYLKRNVK